MSEQDPGQAPDTSPSGDTNYYAGYDDETRGWLDNRGMLNMSAEEALSAAIQGHRNAEKSLGVPHDRRIDLPVDMTAEGALDEVYKKLGRPDAPDQYKFSASEPDGKDKKFDEFFAGAAHKVGLSQANADAMYGSLKEFFNAIGDEADKSAAAEAEAAKMDLQKEWGATFAKNEIVAKAAATHIGLDAEGFDKVIDALGYVEGMKLFQRIGVGFGEDPFVGDRGGLPAGGPSTPEGAREELATLKRDMKFLQKVREGDVKSRQLWDNLHKLAYGG